MDAMSPHDGASASAPPPRPPSDRARSAIVFAGKLARHLERHPALRLPSTYVGVRRVRPERRAKGDARSSGKRKRPEGDGDDGWVPNAIDDGKSPPSENGSGQTEAVDPREIVYKVANPDGTQRRMTTQEKRQLKYQMKKEKLKAQKEERRRQHQERMQEEKRGKRERKRLKKLAWKNKQQQPNEGEEAQDGHDTIAPSTEETKNAQEEEGLDEELATLQEGKRGTPPVMLTPAATCLAQDVGVFHSPSGLERITTILDRELSATWASQLQASMVPAEELRAKEDMRVMAYRLVPEVWKRLCPDALWPPKGEKNAGVARRNNETKHETDESQAAQFKQTYSLALLRNPSPYDQDAYAIVKHLHQHSDLHIACGAQFGCDFLLYDGKREDRHSFAGLRVYSCSKRSGGNPGLPTPSAYDLSGYVRAMNTARKISLVGTVVREGNEARVAIVDLALEKVLGAPTHIKKGNTAKRRTEEEAVSGLARKSD